MSTAPQPKRIPPATQEESIQALRSLLSGISEAPDGAWQQFNVGAMRKLLACVDSAPSGRAERTLTEVRRILTPGIVSISERGVALRVLFDLHDKGEAT